MLMTILTCAILAALFMIIAVPGLVGIVRPKAAIVAAPFYIAIMAGLYTYYVGFSFGSLSEIPVRTTGLSGSICERALAEAERGGLIVDRSNPARVRVDQSMWRQVPQQVRDALSTCLEEGRPPQPGANSVEIVETPRP